MLCNNYRPRRGGNAVWRSPRCNIEPIRCNHVPHMPSSRNTHRVKPATAIHVTRTPCSTQARRAAHPVRRDRRRRADSARRGGCALHAYRKLQRSPLSPRSLSCPRRHPHARNNSNSCVFDGQCCVGPRCQGAYAQREASCVRTTRRNGGCPAGNIVGPQLGRRGPGTNNAPTLRTRTRPLHDTEFVRSQSMCDVHVQRQRATPHGNAMS